MRTKMWRLLATLAATPLLIVGCGGGDGTDQGGDATCPVDALDQADAPVEITFWHALAAENEVVLQDLISQFEAQEPRVHVNLVNQVAYPELLGKYSAGLATGDLPDLAHMEEAALQTVVDSQGTVPIQSCIDADAYELSDYLPESLDFYTTEGTLRSMPWNVSTPVLIYNKNAFRQAGLDPELPPATLDEARDFSQQIVDAGVTPYGMALHVEPYVYEALHAKSGHDLVNNGNGREGRATEAELEPGAAIWSWWEGMVASGLALNTGSQALNYDHLFALGNQQAAMTFDTSAAVGPIEAVLAAGEFGEFDVGVGPLPGVAPGGGVPVQDGSLWIPQASSSEEKAAAWELIKFLDEPAQQAALSVGSRGGYVPIRHSAVDDPSLQALWAQEPWLRVPFDQLESAPSGTATAGAVIGDYLGVRDAIREGFVRMLVEDVPPDDAVAGAQDQANEAIRLYNERIAP